MAREHIEGNLHWLPLSGRTRKAIPKDESSPLLTEAQVEVLSLLAKGSKPQDIAKRRAGSAITVYVQLKDCRDRLGVATNEEAVKKAQELGYVK